MAIFKPISISLSPNTEKDDILLALNLLFKPQLWKRGERVDEIEEEFKKYFGVRYAVSFNSGRSALLAVLRAMGAGSGDEILAPGFTCSSAVIPIIKQGARPVFVDVDETTNINPEDLEKKFSKKSKAVMVQHTFGLPAKVDKISEFCKKNNLFLIEDCAHSLGAKYKSKKVGTFGDAGFFSFGRDKIISSVFGGIAITNSKKIGERLKDFQESLEYPSCFWIFQQLLHPLLMNVLILPAYGLNQYLGRIILAFLHKLSILSKAVSKKEKRGELPKIFPKKFPNALAALALNQFKKLQRFNRHRRKMADFYEKGLEKNNFILPFVKHPEGRHSAFMRYPILTKISTDAILKEARLQKIYLDDGWRKTPIVPPDTDLTSMQYRLGDCPQAEKIAMSIINLPTHINTTLEDAERVVNFIKKYGG